MSKINNGCEILAQVNGLHTTRDSLQCCNSLRSNFGLYFQSIYSGSQRCETIRDVVRADQCTRNSNPKIPALGCEIYSCRAVFDVSRANISVLPQPIIQFFYCNKFVQKIK